MHTVTLSIANTLLVENHSCHEGGLSPRGDETGTTAISVEERVGTHTARCGQVQGARGGD